MAVNGGAAGAGRGAARVPEDGRVPGGAQITFKSLEVFGDSASLTVSFTDGDGDIGLARATPSRPTTRAVFLQPVRGVRGAAERRLDPGGPAAAAVLPDPGAITPTDRTRPPLEGDLSGGVEALPRAIGGPTIRCATA